MGNTPPEMIYASVCAEFLLEVAKAGAMEGVGGWWGSRIWFNQNLILQLNFVPGEEDVRQKRININNVFPSTLRVLNHPN